MAERGRGKRFLVFGWQPSATTDAALKREVALWGEETQLALARVQTMGRVLHALVLREILTRFGRENLGFVWLVLEPLILTIMVMVGWMIMFGTSKQGVPVVQIVLTGYSMLTLWRHIVARFTHCFRHNAGLMFHRNVKPMDTIFARLFLESVGTLVSFFVAYTVLYIIDWIPPIHDVFLLLAAWFLLTFFAFSVALICSALSEIWEPAEKFIQPLMYVTIPFTGAFSMLSWLPRDYHYAFLLSPMLNTVEMFRAALIGPSTQTYYHPDYVILVSLFLTAFAFLLMRKAQAHIRLE
jgi:capsular polysaccharide transport system permease protein